MGVAFNNACQGLLENAQGVTDRFHVARLWNDTLDGLRKKNHAGVQGEAVACGAEGVSVVDVGDASRSGVPDGVGAGEAGAAIRPDTPIADAVPPARALQGDL